MAQRKVKWAVGKDEPEDLQDFTSNDEIVGEHGLPKSGIVRLRIKQVTNTVNKNKDAMIKILAVHEDSSKDRKKFNGYAFFENQNVTDVGAPYLKKFLNAIGASWADFRLKTVEDASEKPPVILRIGNVKFDGKKPVYAWASITKENSEEYGERMKVARWVIRTTQDEAEGDEIEPDEGEEAEADMEVDEEEAAAEEFDEDELREELAGEKPIALRKRLREDYGFKPADYKGLDQDDLVELIVGQAAEAAEAAEEEAEEAGEDEENGEEDPNAELREELAELTLPKLKARARKAGLKVAQLRGLDEDEIIDLIVEEEGEEPPF